jgi:putative colanic acid biosynthesis acetyltransferase WcaF
MQDNTQEGAAVQELEDTSETTEPFYYKSELSLGNQAARAVWGVVWLFLFRPTPRTFRPWRRFLLRLFGARIGRGAKIAQSVQVWAPWNLEMADCSSLSDHVVCYNVGKVTLGASAIVSQYTKLCAASHDIRRLDFPLQTGPITIEERAWVGMDSFIGMNVTVGAYAVVASRSTVIKNVEPYTVVGGSPAKFIKQREILRD